MSIEFGCGSRCYSTRLIFLSWRDDGWEDRWMDGESSITYSMTNQWSRYPTLTTINTIKIFYFFLNHSQTNHILFLFYRRYVVLIKSHLITYKDNMSRDSPTEVIPINNCCTVKSADDELNQKNSFKVLVSDRTFYFIGVDNSDKESWIGALGKAMIKSSVLIDDNLDGAYMWWTRS